MLRRLAAVAACLIFLGAVPTGSLYVTTLPSAADVWIDGTYVGRTPVVLDALATGRHTVGIAKAGWQPQQLDVSIVTAQTTLSSVRLPTAKTRAAGAAGSIALHGAPVDGAFLDGMPAQPAKDGTYPAAAGGHELTVRTPRGKVTRQVTVWPQTRTDVVIQLDEEPGRPAIVAPADDYVPENAIKISGARVVIRFGGHEASGRLGSTSYRLDGRLVEYDAAPTVIRSRLYLPIGLLTAVAGNPDR
jgi:PEGA domain-containing protein